MFNTIILKHGNNRYTNKDYQFEKGDTIWGEYSDPEEIKRWNINQETEALEELKKYKCTYEIDHTFTFAEEYALEWCECDEDGEYIKGSNFELAAKNE